MREVEIHTEPVELFKILKFEGMVASGGEAKRVIDAGEVRVNGEVETRRRRQIRAGDTIKFAGETLVIRLQSPA
jgi:ribosome-associated protein